jgi:hypothetical protein
MSQHQAFKRVAVPVQVAAKLETVTLSAPTRGLVLNENETFMQAGGAVVCDNWKPNMRGLALRGGCELWCQLPETAPVISAFEYVSGNIHEIFACTPTKIYNVSVPVSVGPPPTGGPVEIANTRTSGNYAAAQMSNAAGEWLIVVNDAGDSPMRYDGTTWTTMTAADITGPPAGTKFVYVWNYRNRLFFIEKDSMNAWVLGINSIGGAASMIPLAGAASKGGKLLFGATWSIDAGDGIDDKCVFMTNQGEAIIFTGSDPTTATNWRQEGRYSLSPPLGMNAHISIGGELLVATVDGILPLSGAITKDKAELELSAITRQIKPMWTNEVIDKREYHWSMCKWDEYEGLFVTLPGGSGNIRRCLVASTATGAWSRFTGWDAMCFMRKGDSMFFGTQKGQIMRANRTGYDNGVPYTATLVGGWEMFSSPSQTITWRQSRVAFRARSAELFIPQISATTDYVVTIPSPPSAGVDPGQRDLWDEGLWDEAKWDVAIPTPVVRNTGWVSIGMTGFSHAPIVQITMAQRAKPDIEMISLAATFERVGVNV